MNTHKQEIGNKAEEITQIANKDWPTLNEVSRTPFVIKPKKSVADIETINQNIQSNTIEEDSAIAKMNQQYEQANNISKEENTATVQQPTVQKSVVQQKPIEVGQSEHSYVNTESNTTKVNNGPEDKGAVLKQIGIGLTHLFIINATSLLKPMNFVIQNFSKIFMAIIHLTVPLLMTLWLTKKVDFISVQLQQESTTMYYVYSAVFYLACAFIWIVSQVVAKGVYVSFKHSLKEVAKIGKEKKLN